LALSNIRAGSINSLDEASLQAQVCKLKYPILRDQLLRDVPWQFGHKVKALAVLADDLFNWAYTYQYPSDCLQINRLMINFEEVGQGGDAFFSRFLDRGLPQPNLRQQVKYEILNVDGNRVVGANESELRIDYRAKITDPNLFDSQFVMVISHLLSSEISIPIVGTEKGRQLRSDSLVIYKELLKAAVASNLNEQYHPPSDSEFVSIRA